MQRHRYHIVKLPLYGNLHEMNKQFLLIQLSFILKSLDRISSKAIVHESGGYSVSIWDSRLYRRKSQCPLASPAYPVIIYYGFTIAAMTYQVLRKEETKEK